MKVVVVLVVLFCFGSLFSVTNAKRKFNTWVDQVHELITAMACKEANYDCKDVIILGTQSNDLPCNREDLVATCVDNALKKMAGATCSIGWRHDFGDLSHMHSMSAPGKWTNKQVLDKIVTQAKIWYEKAWHARAAKDPNDQFWIGKIMHMLGDGWSKSHVERDAQKKVVLFQSYAAQDAKKHRKADSSAKIGGAPKLLSQNALKPAKLLAVTKEKGMVLLESAVNAVDAAKTLSGILTIYAKDVGKQASPKLIEDHIRNVVFPFAKDKETAPAGGSHPDYSCDPTGKDLMCGFKFKEALVLGTFTVRNMLKEELTLHDSHVDGCWSCLDGKVPAAHSKSPCEKIAPGATCVFAAESCFGGGPKGKVVYTTQNAQLHSIHFDLPLIGHNSYSCSPSCFFKKAATNRPSVTFTFTEESCAPVTPKDLRTTKVTISNTGTSDLILLTETVKKTWSQCAQPRFAEDVSRPCSVIPAGTSCTFSSEGKSSSGSVAYSYRTKEKEELVSWSNTKSNSALAFTASEGISGTVHKSGINAEVTFVITGKEEDEKKRK